MFYTLTEAPAVTFELPHFLGGMLRNASWLTAGEIAVKGGVLLAGVIIARGMGAGPLGLFTVSYGVAVLITQLLAAGQVEVLIREVAREPKAARTWFRNSSVWQLKAGIPVAGAVGLGMIVFATSTLRWTLLGFLLYALLRSRLITAGAVFKGLERMDIEVKARVIELASALVGLALIAWFELPAWLMGLAFNLGATLGLGWIMARLPHDGASRPDTITPPPDFRKEGLIFVGLAGMFQLLIRGDTLVMATLGLQAAVIGRYGAALMPVLAAIALPQLLAVAIYPILSRSAEASESPQRWILFCLGLGLASGLGTATILDIFGPLMIRLLYGTRYLAASPLLVRAAWLLPGACSSMMIGVVLAAWRQQHLGLAALASVTVPALLLDILIIPVFGLMGAVNVAVVAHSMIAIISAVLAWTVKRQVNA